MLPEMLGWPVALKIVSRAVLHKSDVGGVVLGVTGAEEVRDACATIRRRIEQSGHAGDLEAILVQPMAPRGVEMLVGATRDATFGSVIAFGTGGVQLALWNDVVIRLGPVSAIEASRMVDSVVGASSSTASAAPHGRPEPPLRGDCPGVALMDAVPEVAELDLNRLLALEPGRGVVAVDARVGCRTSRCAQHAISPGRRSDGSVVGMLADLDALRWVARRRGLDQ